MSVINFSARELGTFAALCTKLNLANFNTAVDLCVAISKGNCLAYSATYGGFVAPESRDEIYDEALTAINDPTRLLHETIGGFAYNMVSNSGKVFAGTNESSDTPDLLKTVRDFEETIKNWRSAEIAKAEKAELNARLAAMKTGELYPHLTMATETLHGSKLAAKNIRIELKKNFPGTKFSVRTSHNSVRISWENGPSVKSVEKFTSRHDSGTFDAMTDCPGWDHSNAFGKVYGECRYVFESRDCSNETHEVVAKSYAVASGREFTSMNDYPTNDHSYWSVARIILNGYDIPTGHRVTGVERTEVTFGAGSCYHEFYSLTTELIPADVVEATAAKAKVAPFREDGYLCKKAYPTFVRTFRKREVAERELAKLAKKGHECEIVTNGRYYRIKKTA